MNPKYPLIILLFSLIIPATALGAEQLKGAEIPWDKVPADKVTQVREVLNSHTLSRRVEDSYPLCNPATFDYMMDRLRITNVVMREVSPQLERCAITNLKKEGSYFIDDQVRTVGTVELLYKTSTYRLYLAKGRWRYWGDNYFSATVVASVSYYPSPQDPRNPLKTILWAYIKLESPVMSALTKVIDVLLPVLVDRRVALMKFSIRAAGEKMCQDPQYVYELLLKDTDISETERNEYETTFLFNSTKSKGDSHDSKNN